MARGLMVQLPTADEPAILYNALAKRLGVDPLFESKVFAEYVGDPWYKMPSLLRERYGSGPSRAVSSGTTVAVVEINEGGVITTHPLEVTAPDKKPAGYNPITSPTQVTPLVMRKRAANS